MNNIELSSYKCSLALHGLPRCKPLYIYVRDKWCTVEACCCWFLQKIFECMWVNCRSGGLWGDGPRDLPFPPLLLPLRSHCTLHSQTSNSPSEPTSVSPDSQCCCAHTQTQRPHTLQLLQTHSSYYRHTAVTTDTAVTAHTLQLLQTHSSYYRHTAVTTDTQQLLQTHCSYYRHTAVTTDTQQLLQTPCSYYRHTAVTTDTQQLLHTHCSYYRHTALLQTHSRS